LKNKNNLEDNEILINMNKNIVHSSKESSKPKKKININITKKLSNLLSNDKNLEKSDNIKRNIIINNKNSPNKKDNF
jgi:hypothetical protein